MQNKESRNCENSKNEWKGKTKGEKGLSVIVACNKETEGSTTSSSQPQILLLQLLDKIEARLIKIWVNHVEHVTHVHTSIHAHTDAHARTHAYTMFELDPASPVVSPLARR